MIYKIWFSRIDLSNRVKYGLLKRFKEKELFFMTESELELIGLEEKQRSKILESFFKKNNFRYLEIMEKEKIKLIKFDEDIYPEKLRNIDDFPVYIFVKGDEKILNNYSIGIVGSRKASIEGMQVARKFAKEIAEKDLNVVSGLAVGIDSAAHIGTLDSLGSKKTIAVLGNGLLESDLYPRFNLNLFRKIIDCGGAIVSEYIIGTEANKYHFPARNRIISGLSDKLIVVEANKKSGSLITVDFALEQGKDIFALPRKHYKC